ncbi:uncharacterized protein LOC135937015 isoform X2 [Cloeon dipterum]|uniref:uncharacterized protein LOC135936668 isoform X2 n=1 Tax=Cloeon dipterum TaxID=197152 RepID=UPI00321F8272
MVKHPAAVAKREAMDYVALSLTSLTREEQAHAIKCFSVVVKQLGDVHSSHVKRFMKENGDIFNLNLANPCREFGPSYEILETSRRRGWLNQKANELFELVMYKHLSRSTDKELRKYAADFHVKRNAGKNVLLSLSRLLCQNNENLEEMWKPIGALIGKVNPDDLDEVFHALTHDEDLSNKHCLYLTEVLKHFGEIVQKKELSELENKFKVLLVNNFDQLTQRFKENLEELESLKNLSQFIPSKKYAKKANLEEFIKNQTRQESSDLNSIPKKKLKRVDLSEVEKNLVQWKKNLPSIISHTVTDKKALEALEQAKFCLENMEDGPEGLALKCNGIVKTLARCVTSEDADEFEQLVLEALTVENLACHVLLNEDEEMEQQSDDVPSIKSFTIGVQRLLLTGLGPKVGITALQFLFEILLRSPEVVEVDEDLLVINLQELILRPTGEAKIAVGLRINALKVICHIRSINVFKKVSAELFLAVGDGSCTSIQKVVCRPFLQLFAEATKSIVKATKAKDKIRYAEMPWHVMIGYTTDAIERADKSALDAIILRIQVLYNFLFNCALFAHESFYQRSVEHIVKELGKNRTDKFKKVTFTMLESLWLKANYGQKNEEILLAAFGAPLVGALTLKDRKQMQKKFPISRCEKIGSKYFGIYHTALTEGTQDAPVNDSSHSPDVPMRDSEDGV